MREETLMAFPFFTTNLLVLVLMLGLVHVSAGAHSMGSHERLIGWKGETHRVVVPNPKVLRKDSTTHTRPPSSSPVWIAKDLHADESSNPSPCTSSPRASSPRVSFISRSSHKLKYAHMAMIHALPGRKRNNGTTVLIAAWQASSTREGENDQHIRITTLSGDLMDDAADLDRWSPSIAVPLPARGALWGPLFFTDDDDDPSVLHLFYSESHGGCPGGPMRWAPGGSIMHTKTSLTPSFTLSELAWSKPNLVYALEADGGIPKVTANKPIAFTTDKSTTKRRWVLPFWRERALLDNRNTHCKAHMRGKQSAGVLISDDNGQSWTPHGVITLPTTWLIENAVASLGDDRLLMVFRSRAGHVYGARSDDAGITWGGATPLRASRADVSRGAPALIPNPNAKIDMIRINDMLVLAFNDHQQPRDDKTIAAQGCVKCRTHLTVATSTDMGNTWSRVASQAFENELGASLRLHYPTVIAHPTEACTVLVAYSRFYVKSVVTADMLPTQGIKVAHVALG